MTRRAAALAAAVLTLGLATGATASAGLALAGRDAAAAAAGQRSATVRSALHTTFQRYADTIADLAAAATGGAGAVDTLLARVTAERLPGAHQVLFLGPARTVLVTHTVDGTAPAAPAVDPALARALELSRVTGRTVATPAHVLPVDAGLPPAHRQPAFELAAPVPAGGGWIVVSVRANDLLDTALAGAGATGVAALLTETTPDGATHEIARWPVGAAGRAAGRGPADRLDVPLAGHAWQVLILRATPRDTPVEVPLVALAGALIGLLAAAAVLAANSGRRRAEARAARATAGRESERGRAEQAERALRDRQAELTGLAATAATHLHAPLHTIAGYADLLLDEELNGTAREFVHRIGRSTQRMLGLVDELLAYAAATDAALRLEPVDVDRLAGDVVAAHRHSAGERPSIDVGELPLVTADADLLRQVLDQFVGNAVRFVRQGTAARITVGARRAAGRLVAHRGGRPWHRRAGGAPGPDLRAVPPGAGGRGLPRHRSGAGDLPPDRGAARWRDRRGTEPRRRERVLVHRVGHWRDRPRRPAGARRACPVDLRGAAGRRRRRLTAATERPHKTPV